MSGQEEPKWPTDKPLALTINHFAPKSKEHHAQGTPTDKISQNGRPLPRLFSQVTLPVTKRLTLKNAIVVR